MIKFPILTISQFKAIQDAKNSFSSSNMLPESKRNFGNSSLGSRIGMVHNVITLSTDELDTHLLNEGANSIRVAEILSEGISAIYNLSAGKTDWQVNEILTDSRYTSSFQKVYFSAYTKYENKTSVNEIALIRIPAILCEVIWIKDADPAYDRFIPVRSVGQLKENEEYSKEEFLAIARKEAAKLEEQKDNEGA